MDAVHIDGQTGGGQILRSSLSLSVLFDRLIKVTNIRGNRDNPGLRAQHLTGLRVISRLTSGFVSGGYTESPEVEFQPRRMPFGYADMDIGTAGSITLLFDLVLPLGPVLDESIPVSIDGGTDVKWSPTTAYYDQVRLPAAAKWGVDADMTVERTGFYPAGGGRATLEVAPSSLTSHTMTDRGELESIDVISKASESLADSDVAERQVEGVTDVLEAAGLSVDSATSNYVEAESTGTSVLVTASYEHATVGFDALGERGRPAEDVGSEAGERLVAFHDTEATVDRHLADQLMVPVALGGGEYVAPTLTDHMETNAEVIRAFDVDIDLEETDDGVVVSAPGVDPDRFGD